MLEVKGEKMNQTDEQTNHEQEAQEQEERVVPVSESIRYRRRAQLSEKKAGELELELARTRSQAEELAGKLEGLSVENKLLAKLAQAGATDLEAALLLAKTRLADDGGEIDNIVSQLKKEKPHLFGQAARTVAAKTAGAKDKAAPATSALERAAGKASQSAHSRASLHEYMRARRKF
jgi:hypothetical protein